MKLAEIQNKAKSLGIKPSKMKKVDLIRTIQSQEGNSSCFQTQNDSCPQGKCCWREDCLMH